MEINSNGLLVNDENAASVVNRGVPVPGSPRTPLANLNMNISQTNTVQATKTPTKSSIKQHPSTSGKKIVQIVESNVDKSKAAETPVRALNESLFEVVVESPRDLKIKELTRMVRAFKHDAKYIRDIYSEEIETLRQELSTCKEQLHQQQDQHRPSEYKAENSPSTTLPNQELQQLDAAVLNERCEQNFGLQHANSIISEAESIIAMAEAMLQANKTKGSQVNASAEISITATNTTTSKQQIRSRETELLNLKEELFNANLRHKRDQQKIQEMEVVMRGMASKLEEYSKAHSNNSAGAGPDSDDNWTNRVLSFFS